MILEHAQGSVADIVNHGFGGIIKSGNVCNRVDDHDILVSHILFHGSSAAGQEEATILGTPNGRDFMAAAAIRAFCPPRWK